MSEGQKTFGARMNTCIFSSVSLGVERKLCEKSVVVNGDIWNGKLGFEEGDEHYFGVMKL